MKASRLRPLFQKYLMPILPGFAFKGSIIYAEPIRYLLGGFSFDSAAHNKDGLRGYYFVQPLYVPKPYIYYTYARELTPGEVFTPENEAEIMEKFAVSIQRKGLPFLNSIKTPEDLARRAGRIADGNDTHVKEVIAYSWILCCEYEKAKRELSKLQRQIQREIKRYPHLTWMVDDLACCERIQSDLNISPETALKTLREWRIYTLTGLKLPITEI